MSALLCYKWVWRGCGIIGSGHDTWVVLAYKWAWDTWQGSLTSGCGLWVVPTIGHDTWVVLTSGHGTYGRALLQVGVAHGQGSPGTVGVACGIYMYMPGNAQPQSVALVSTTQLHKLVWHVGRTLSGNLKPTRLYSEHHLIQH